MKPRMIHSDPVPQAATADIVANNDAPQPTPRSGAAERESK